MGVIETRKREVSVIAGAAIGIFGGAFVWSFLSTIYGASLPEISAALALSPADGGAVFSLWSLGFMAGGIIAGLLGARLKPSLIGFASTILTACGALAIGQVSAGNLLVPAMVATAVFGGIMLTVISASIGAIAGKSGRSGALGLMDVFFSAGTIAAPAFVLLFVDGWRVSYATAFVLMLILAWPITFAARHGSSHLDAPKTDPAKRRLLRDGFLLVSILAAFAGAGIEWGSALWLVSILQEAKALPAEQAKLGLSLFAGGMMTARLSLGLLLRRISAERLLVVAGLGSVVTVFALWLGQGLWLMPLAFLVGLFCGPVFPLVMGRALDRHPDKAVSVSGLILPATGLGAAVVSALAGWLATQYGMTSTPLVMLACALILCASLPVIARKQGH